ncbi:DUF6776 family protein [Lysobacter koreensis]|uniref:DUF6776 family protein n=1 Tax=Lysobacter koreensis TaxID=266122 RepID=A0ABW2YPL7_9GAMM
MAKPPPRFMVVERRRSRRPLAWAAFLVVWALSLFGAWSWAGWRAAPRLDEVSAQLGTTSEQLRRYQREIGELRQRQATLARSDQISRSANRQIQRELAQREREIATLRGKTAFYERLGGATAQPRGLNVHSARFLAEAGGSWRYQVVLTQSLTRGGVSLGKLRFAVEGVRAGKLATIHWDELHQRAAAPAQDYSFRYFQQLDGSVMLPPGFTPQRVRVSLRGQDAAVEQTVAWEHAGGTHHDAHAAQTRPAPAATRSLASRLRDT